MGENSLNPLDVSNTILKEDRKSVNCAANGVGSSLEVQSIGSKYILSRLVKIRHEESTEVLDDLFSTFQHEFEMRSILHEWHLNTVKSKACSLAVWAVDQGNRKVYEMERALMAENSWIARSIVWDGFSAHPLTGITNSKWFWASSAAKELGDDRVSIICEQLQVLCDHCCPQLFARVHVCEQIERQRNEVLRGQLALAREQLIEWQVCCSRLSLAE